MTTFQNAIDETRDHLMTGLPDRVNVLDANIDADPASTLITFQYTPEAINTGTRLSIGLEEMHVVSGSGNTATVIRAFNGTSATAHNSGDVIRINPQFTDAKIARQLNRCLEALSGEGLFWVDDVSFTFIPSVAGYDLAMPGVLDIWRVRYDVPGPRRDWPVLRPQDYYFDQHPDETDFPNGTQLVLRQGGSAGREVRVSYKRSFTTLTDLSDTLEGTAHLHSTAHEIPPMGAAFRLATGREIKRSFLNRQPEPRRQQEVPPGSANQSMRPLVESYYNAIDRETKVLHQRYPTQL